MATSPIAEASSAALSDAFATRPHTTPPAAKPSWKASSHAARARPRTQAGATICAAVSRLVTTVIHATPATTSTTAASGGDVITESAATTAATTRVPAAVEPLYPSQACSRGSTAAPATAPPPMHAISSPKADASSPSRRTVTTGSIAHIALPKRTNSAVRPMTIRSGAEKRR